MTMLNAFAAGACDAQIADYDYVIENGVPILRSRQFHRVAAPAYNDQTIVVGRLESETTYNDPAQEDLFDFAFIRQFSEAWKDSIEELYQLHLKRLISDRTFHLSLAWMANIYRILRSISEPEIANSGDGGVDIEWQKGSNLISVHIANNAEGIDSLYVREGDQSNIFELKSEHLLRFGTYEEIFAAFV